MKEIISIQISQFLTNELAEKIAQKQWKSSAPPWTNRSRQYIFDELINGNDCFGVIATSSNNDVVGRLHCIKNEDNPKLWYYGDLFVIPEYRRLGIATEMICAAINHLSDMGAAALRCYVEPNNVPSRNLQLSIGFSEQPFESFNNLINDGEIMYEKEIPNQLSIIQASVNEAYFVRILFVQNKDALNTENISLSEWKALLCADDADEKHFLVCKGAMPVAYMKINGLNGTDNAWLSMLFVAKNFQRQGIGSFAVKFAEKYLQDKGVSMLSIQTTSENVVAQNFLQKSGYQVLEQNERIKYRKILQE